MTQNLPPGIFPKFFRFWRLAFEFGSNPCSFDFRSPEKFKSPRAHLSFSSLCPSLLRSLPPPCFRRPTPRQSARVHARAPERAGRPSSRPTTRLLLSSSFKPSEHSSRLLSVRHCRLTVLTAAPSPLYLPTPTQPQNGSAVIS